MFLSKNCLGSSVRVFVCLRKGEGWVLGWSGSGFLLRHVNKPPESIHNGTTTAACENTTRQLRNDSKSQQSNIFGRGDLYEHDSERSMVNCVNLISIIRSDSY